MGRQPEASRKDPANQSQIYPRIGKPYEAHALVCPEKWRILSWECLMVLHVGNDLILVTVVGYH